MMVELKTHPVINIFEVAGVTFLAFLLSVLVGVIFLVPLLFLGYGIGNTLVLVGITIVGQIGFLVVGYLYIYLRKIKVPINPPSRSDLLHIGGGTILVLITAIVLSRVLLLFDLMPQSVIEDIGKTDPTFLLILAILSIVLIAPAEELLFRGAIQGRLRQNFGPLPAILTASFLFGSLHLGNYDGGFLLPIIAGAFLIVVIGLILGVLYKRTKNLLVPIFVHAVYNIVILVTSYLTLV